MNQKTKQKKTSIGSPILLMIPLECGTDNCKETISKEKRKAKEREERKRRKRKENKRRKKKTKLERSI